MSENDLNGLQNIDLQIEMFDEATSGVFYAASVKIVTKLLEVANGETSGPVDEAMAKMTIYDLFNDEARALRKEIG
jgi:hypothetical protein